MERLLDTASYEAAENGGTTVTVDSAYVDQHLTALAKDEDLSRYIL
jgi:ATP-dependent HslUV protease ATP-binding subunit HslU